MADRATDNWDNSVIFSKNLHKEHTSMLWVLVEITMMGRFK